jgi:hypothetical protein
MTKLPLRRLGLTAILPALLLLLGAGDDTSPPTSPAALAIIKRHDRTVGDAQHVFDQVKKKADADAIKQLKLLERDAMRAGNLTEADAIEAKCKSMTGDTDTLTPDARAILGTWEIAKQKWTIGAAAIKHPDGDIGKPTFQGPSCLAQWGTGSTDRFTVLSNGLILHEGWSHGQHIGVDVPDWVEEGTRVDQ